MRSALLALVVLLFAPTLGEAVEGSRPLGAQEIRTMILGKRLFGVREATGERWFECIYEDNRTLYNIEGRVSSGFVEVTDDGRTCFTYPAEGESRRACFTARRENGTPVFVEVTSGERFRVLGIDERFEVCESAPPVS